MTATITGPTIGCSSITRNWCVISTVGAEPLNSFGGVSRGPLYCKLTTRHHTHTFRDYVSPNQSCEVFGLFGPSSWQTLIHVSGHVTRATWVLKIPCESPWVVDDFRHWNFSICSKDIGVMAVLMEGCNCKIHEKNGLLWRVPFFAFLLIIPPH